MLTKSQANVWQQKTRLTAIRQASSFMSLRYSHTTIRLPIIRQDNDDGDVQRYSSYSFRSFMRQK